MLTTERLILTPITPDDIADLHAIYRDERAMRYMPSPPHTELAQTREAIERDLAMQGALYMTIRRKDDPRAIGYVGFLGGTQVSGMGYLLHPEYWGQGIAGEACRAALDYGFSTRGYDRVELWIDEVNAASIRVAQKLGFRVKGRLPIKYAHRERYHFLLVYGMLASEWTNAGAAPEVTRFFAVEPVLMTHDVRATVDFYHDKLGFNVDFLYGDPPNHAGVSRGEWTGSMVTVQIARVPPEREIQPSSYLHIRVDSRLDALCEEYRARGVTIIAEPEAKPWGFCEFAIKDPNGTVLVFASHI
jgi:RimJ/RimL family protein N-acetyltransferase/uncharacterized glyoxalase superfamily protein PhnB